MTSLLWLFWAWQIRHKALTVSGLAVYLTEPAETDILLHKLTGRGVQELGDAFEQLPAFEPHGREYILQVGPSPHSSVSFLLTLCESHFQSLKVDPFLSVIIDRLLIN